MKLMTAVKTRTLLLLNRDLIMRTRILTFQTPILRVRILLLVSLLLVRKDIWIRGSCSKEFGAFNIWSLWSVYGTAVRRTLHTHTIGSKLRCQTPTKHTTKYLWTTTSNFS